MASPLMKSAREAVNAAGRAFTKRFQRPTRFLTGRAYPILEWLSPRRPFVRLLEREDFLIYVSLLDLSVSNGLLTQGTWEPLTTAALKRAIKPGMVVVDIGAQLGYYTLLAGKLVGEQGCVFAFEPDQRHLKLLRRSVEANHLENVQISPKAVTSRTSSGQVTLNAWAPSLPVEMVRLDDFWGEGVRPVDFIKIDIDGGEIEALKGMEQTLAQSETARMLIEYDPWQYRMTGQSPKDLLRGLTDLGFRVELIIDELQSKSGPADWKDVAAIDRSVNLLLTQPKAPAL